MGGWVGVIKINRDLDITCTDIIYKFFISVRAIPLSVEQDFPPLGVGVGAIPLSVEN